MITELRRHQLPLDRAVVPKENEPEHSFARVCCKTGVYEQPSHEGGRTYIRFPWTHESEPFLKVLHHSFDTDIVTLRGGSGICTVL
jgi:hypothetical protein